MDLSRRDVLRLAMTGGVASLAAACAGSKETPAAEPKPAPPTAPAPDRMPVVFISHGSPMVAITPDDYWEALKWMGEDLPRPKAIVVVSAHWQEERPIRVTSGAHPETIHDFGGFPEKLYLMRYPSPGQPTLAAEISKTLTAGGFPARLEDRGLDHGAWIPLKLAYPGAEVPVLQVTLRYDLSPADYLKLGSLLAPLRERGVLIVGSGGVVHTFREMRRTGPGEKPDAWAVEFDKWFRDRLAARDFDSLANYRKAHPSGERAAPTTEHFDPIFVTLGASDAKDRVVDVYDGFRGANLSMRTFALRS
jgi:4,5-DOPA dioxygenase extradiol